MFEWEGEELANIIWGKTGENEDHIVPYPDETYEITQNPYEEDRNVSPSNTTKLDLEHTDEKALVDSNFVDYDWTKVGSFDDLDRILSNNDLVYENTNISSMESSSLHVETKSRFIKDVNTNLELMECSEGKNGKIYRFSQSASSNNAQRISSLVYPNGDVNVAMPDENGIGIGIGIGKAHMGTKGETCDPWFSLGNQGKEFERGYTQHIKIPSSMARNQETEYKKSPCGYNNIMGNQQFQSGSSSLMMPLSMMTPQEKIEKLRRRQQMRALLAICKQQQEFRQNSSITSCSNESQIDENLSTLVMNTSSLEDAILHQLENVVSTVNNIIRELKYHPSYLPTYVKW